jgi:hypothetical protein
MTRQAWVAAIGSRETPPPFLKVIRTFGATLVARGVGLRSGGARGADTAFEDGAGQGPTQIFVVNTRPDGTGIALATLDPRHVAEAARLAAAHHPAWERVGDYPRQLLTRNCFQVLGPELDDPSALIACWAIGTRWSPGRGVVDVAGGTGLAVRLATTRGIPVLNLALPAHLELARRWHRTPDAALESLVDSVRRHSRSRGPDSDPEIHDA